MACMTSIVSLCLTSCVNEAYDLSKGIDTSIDINADISVPFGSTQKILIGDLLEEMDMMNLVLNGMSGTGSACFALSKDKKLLERAAHVFEKEGHKAYITQFAL